MAFLKRKIRNYYLYSTPVDNLFLAEYMLSAPGEYVKVYLLALMYADLGMPCDNAVIAKETGLALEDVLKAWNHWESMHLVKKHRRDSENPLNYDIEFLNIIETTFAPPEEADDKQGGSQSSLATKREVEELFTGLEALSGRLLEGREIARIASWISEDGVSPAIISEAYKYCIKNGKPSRFAYVEAIIKDWHQRGFKTTEDVDAYLEETDMRRSSYRRIFRALGFSRNPSEEEMRIMDKWFDVFGFSMDEILDACRATAGINSPNIKYVNAVLAGRYRDKNPSADGRRSGGDIYGEVMRLYDRQRAENKEITLRRRAEVYSRLPQVKKIEERIEEIYKSFPEFYFLGEKGKNFLASAKAEVENLEEEKEKILVSAGYPGDATNWVYTCRLCRDTGIDEDGNRCSCFNDKVRYISEEDGQGKDFNSI